MARLNRWFVALLAVLVTVFWATPAGAHTGFESSDPTDGAVVGEPVSVVTVSFSGAAEPAGEGFVVLDPVRGTRGPTAVETIGEGVFRLRFDPPLAGGEVGVRWSVRAPDAHPISGSFRFRVDAPAPQPPPEQEPAAAAGPAQPRAENLDDFLASDQRSAAGQLVADVGRFGSMGATMVAVGFLVFALAVMRGGRRELRMLLFWVRRAGVVLAAGTLVDALGQVTHQGGGPGALFQPGAYADALAGGAGVALLLRFAGGAVIAACADLVMVHAREARDVLIPLSASLPIGAGSVRVADRRPNEWHAQDLAWELDRRGTVVLGAVAAVLLSHVFDGHTVTEGNRILTGLASSVHVLAGAVWAGGVVALALVIHRRWRRGEPTHALVMVTRFSVVATIALAVVAAAGVYLAVVILDSPSGLWQTEWGRYFLAKFTLVAVAGAFGAHNHHVIVPALEVAEEKPSVLRTLRSTLVKEVAALTGVTILTALLVRAASTL